MNFICTMGFGDDNSDSKTNSKSGSTSNTQTENSTNVRHKQYIVKTQAVENPASNI